MVPMKHSAVFRSRWFALLWAAGILWFAYDMAGTAPADGNGAAVATDATGAEVTNADMRELQQAIDGI